MDYNETNDWKTIAHDEYENRKKIELQLSRVTTVHNHLQNSLQSTTSYNEVLERQLKDLNAKYTKQEASLKQSIELLKKAKFLIAKRKEELDQLTTENADLKNNLHKKSALLEAEMLQHDKTNQKLATTLGKLAATTAAAVTGKTITARKDAVIYAEGPTEDFKLQILATPDNEDQMFYVDEQSKQE